MINIISAILFSFSANIDNIAIGLAYGVKKIHIPFYKNILISIFTTAITIISMKLGSLLFLFFNEYTTNLIGSIGLVSIGVIGIMKGLYENLSKKTTEESNHLKDLNIKEMITIIFTLSINNIAAGIAASIAGINLMVTLISTLLFSCLFLNIGNTLGKTILNKVFEKYSEFASSFILILLGIIQFLF